MRIITFLMSLLLTGNASALVYQFEKGDELGGVLLSLGHKELWTGKRAINKFKHRVQSSRLKSIQIGRQLSIGEDEILFKKNIEIKDDALFIKRKIKTLAEWNELYKNETTLDSAEQVAALPAVPAEKIEDILVSNEIKEEVGAVLNVYAGGGLFSALDTENDRSSKTSTFIGVQPMLVLKAIYGHSSWGSLASELMVKKIVNSGYSFPINYDYRLQAIPSFAGAGAFNIAFSFSTISHSYLGKPGVTKIEYELNSHFLGIGLVYPREDFWFELYIEKAIRGQTASGEQSLEVNRGFRLDSEVVYPVKNSGWFVVPGLNYYQSKNSSYEISVLETRLNFTREFEWTY